MAVGDECTLRIVGRYQDQNIVNTLHYRITGQTSGEPEILDQLTGGWDVNYKSGWLARHEDAYELVGLKAFGKTGASKTPSFRSIGDAGTVAGTPLMAAVCRTITLYTADAKHRRRGRIMLSGTDDAMIDDDDGSVSTTEIAALTAFGVVLLPPLVVNSDEFQLGIPATAVDTWQDITDAKGRETPSLISSRRIRQFLIG